MQYSLGNMLNGGGGLNADGLALDLQFALDKTLTARKGPTPVFTRASSGTFVGSNGLIQTAATNIPRFDHTSAGVCRGLLIEESRTNLLLQSENFGTTWMASQLNVSGSPAYLNVATAPDGTTTADKIIANTTATTHQFRQDISITSGTTYTLSCFFKAAELNTIGFTISGGVTGTHLVGFDLSNGTRFGNLSGFSAATITPFANNWYRCTATFTATSTATSSIRIAGVLNSGANPPLDFYAGDGTSGVLIWGAQIETGSFATSYIPTTTGSVVRSADVCSITGSNFTSFYNQSEGTIIGQGIVDTVGVGIIFPYFASFNDGTANNRVLLGSTNSAGAGVRPIVAAAGSTVFSNAIGASSAGQSRKVGMVYKQNDFIAAHNGTLTAADNTGNVPSGIDRVSFDGPFFVGTIAAIRYYRKRLSNAKLQALTA